MGFKQRKKPEEPKESYFIDDDEEDEEDEEDENEGGLRCSIHDDGELNDCFQCDGTYCDDCFNFCPCGHPGYWSVQELMALGEG